jgi:hypothetical protein
VGRVTTSIPINKWEELSQQFLSISGESCHINSYQ